VDKQRQLELVRAMGRWSLSALSVNSVIGGGIFGLPLLIAGLVGGASPLAYLIAAMGAGTIMACFAEVGSRFTESGGPYLYARVAFGRLIGIQMGWFSWLSRVAAFAANANLFVFYLAEFWPHATAPLFRIIVLTLIVGLPAAVNYRGVKAGAQFSTIFTLAKLLPLAIFVVGGIFYLIGVHNVHWSTSSHGGALGNWLEALLLTLFAYTGFETAVTPVGEAKDPRRDVPFALLTTLVTCTVLYTLIQVVVIGVLPEGAKSDRPLAAAAHVFMGTGGAVLITVGALVSLYGWFGALMLSVPRVTFALAEHGDFPPLFGRVHTRFRTPHFSILGFAILVWLLAIGGNYRWNVAISVFARLLYYGAVCVALPVLRKKQPGGAAFVLPAGPAFAVLGVGITLLLGSRMDIYQLGAVLATVSLGVATWLWARRGKPELV
jgi:amino acid transporter